MRVVVTGMGIISSIGFSVDETLKSLLNRRPGIGKIKYLNTIHNDIPCAEIQLDDDGLRQMLDISQDEIITRTSMMGIAATREALDSSLNRSFKTHEQSLTDQEPATYRHSKSNRYNLPDSTIGFINGTTVGGMEKSEQYYTDFTENLDHKEYIDAHDCGACSEKIADYFNCFDFISTTSTACSSAANAIILGAKLIKSGRLDMAVVGGTECLTKFHLNGFNSLMILDHEPCRPFDKSRSGLNLGEGAAYLVIESLDHAKNRGANILCELSGYGNSCDAHHQTASSPDGKGAYLAMHEALNMTGLRPDEVSYINAHGTGTGNNDLSEANAMLALFNGKVPPFSSTKPYTGHTTSAAGSIEAVISILALQNDFLPPNLNFIEPMEETGLIPVTTLTKNIKLQHILSNSFGFGGNDSSIVFSKL